MVGQIEICYWKSVDNFDNFVCPVLPLPFVIRQSIICSADKRWAARD